MSIQAEISNHSGAGNSGVIGGSSGAGKLDTRKVTHEIHPYHFSFKAPATDIDICRILIEAPADVCVIVVCVAPNEKQSLESIFLRGEARELAARARLDMRDDNSAPIYWRSNNGNVDGYATKAIPEEWRELARPLNATIDDIIECLRSRKDLEAKRTRVTVSAIVI